LLRSELYEPTQAREVPTRIERRNRWASKPATEARFAFGQGCDRFGYTGNLSGRIFNGNRRLQISRGKFPIVGQTFPTIPTNFRSFSFLWLHIPSFVNLRKT
jgi:hypothetical protein